MKKVLSILLLLLVLFAGCDTNNITTELIDTTSLNGNLLNNGEDVSQTNNFSNEEYQTSIEDFSFDMSPEDILVILEKRKISLILPSEDDDEINPNKDGRHFEPINNSFYYKTDEITFCYDSKNELNSIVIQKDFKTNEGIGIGDDVLSVKDIYGEKYEVVYDWYQYYDGNVYLAFMIKNDVVTSWKISTIYTGDNGP